jgi:SAM-dependent methyltransferase
MAKTEMEFTGERVVPGKTPDTIYKEHIDRYIFAATLTAGRDVLDVACGSGYGTGYMAETGARSVTGVDVSMMAVRYARDWYGNCPGTGFLCADGVGLPFVEGSFDVVVSFETLEHIRPYRKFLLDCRRVLREDACLIVSTPNRRIFSPDVARPPNPFHVKEFWPDEFRRLIEGLFADVTLFGQCDVNLADNSVDREHGVRDFRDNDSVSSAYIIAVARKRANCRRKGRRATSRLYS